MGYFIGLKVHFNKRNLIRVPADARNSLSVIFAICHGVSPALDLLFNLYLGRAAQCLLLHTSAHNQ
jgi:hypothetical protein